MKRFVSLCFFIFWITLFFVPYIHAQALKIGVFDLQRIMRDSKAIQGYRKTLEREVESKKKVLVEKQDSVKLIEEKLKREDKGMSPDERKRLEERLGNELKELRRLREDIDMDLKKVDRELSQRALREIGETVRELAQKEKYSMVFEKSLAGIAFVQDSFDITTKVIEIYDSKR